MLFIVDSVLCAIYASSVSNPTPTFELAATYYALLLSMRLNTFETALGFRAGSFKKWNIDMPNSRSHGNRSRMRPSSSRGPCFAGDEARHPAGESIGRPPYRASLVT